MSNDIKRYKKAMEIATGKRKADFVIKNADVVNVFTEKIVRADIAIADGTFVGVGSFSGERELDALGRTVCPGYIDAHLHLESTLVTPATLINQAALCGTTTFIVDPHESANVSGTDGIDYIIEQTEGIWSNVFVMMPSCVPSTPIDDGGAVIGADDMKPYLSNKRILGLGEVMDYIGVLSCDEALYDKLRLFASGNIDGHAPHLPMDALSGYVYAGIGTDHESTTYEYAMEERSRGMKVLIREGSAARNLEAIVKGLVEHGDDLSGFAFCTDDKHIEDIKRDGHINYNVRKAIALGIPPVSAVRMATINAAETYGLKRLGAIAPGRQADFIIFDDFRQQRIASVYYKGRRIEDQNGAEKRPFDARLLDTVHIGDFTREKLRLRVTKEPMPVIRILPGEIVTEKAFATFPEGDFVPDERYAKIAVVERHKATGKVGLGIVEGFGITGGAIASSVSHDAHNIVVIGDNDEDMYRAVQEIRATSGGFAIVSNQERKGLLPLSIMGLISREPYELTNEKLAAMIRTAHEMGVPEGVEPFIALSFMALPVIPKLRITPRGMFDVEKQCFYGVAAPGEDKA